MSHGVCVISLQPRVRFYMAWSRNAVSVTFGRYSTTFCASARVVIILHFVSDILFAVPNPQHFVLYHTKLLHSIPWCRILNHIVNLQHFVLCIYYDHTHNSACDILYVLVDEHNFAALYISRRSYNGILCHFNILSVPTYTC